MDPEKRGRNMGLKNMSDFRELYFTKIMCNVIWISSFTNRYLNYFGLKIVLAITQIKLKPSKHQEH